MFKICFFFSALQFRPIYSAVILYIYMIATDISWRESALCSHPHHTFCHLFYSSWKNFFFFFCMLGNLRQIYPDIHHALYPRGASDDGQKLSISVRKIISLWGCGLSMKTPSVSGWVHVSWKLIPKTWNWKGIITWVALRCRCSTM